CAGEVPVVDISSVTAADNCSGVAVTHVADVITNQTCASRYTIERTYRATDAAGNAVTCTQIITVNDQTAPVISCPANITTATPVGSCNAVVSFAVTATDNCSGPVTITTMPASGSVFPMGTTTVTATATDACGNSSVCTFTVTVTDGQLPVIAAQPANQVICAEGDAAFSVTASNVLSYQWQIQQGGNWVNINGANNSTYTIANVTPSMSGRVYRVMLTGHCTTIYSAPATLTVNQLPQPSILTPAEVCIDDRSIQLQATPAGGAFSGPGITGNNWNLEIPAAGNHSISYTYTDGNGCTVTTSKVVNLRFCTSFKSVLELQAYPNPTDGKVTVKALITMDATWSIGANDLVGRQVWQKDIPLRKGWNVFEVDLTGKLPGLYIITLSRGGGRKADIKVLKAN
ncbi:MAG: HYR domain-containing protein, partial [Chitinophagaceae bacterium]|nr:HYR domain-containing protein [Chitinophagaceae bacterium]